jgi:hypothetical protein
MKTRNKNNKNNNVKSNTNNKRNPKRLKLEIPEESSSGSDSESETSSDYLYKPESSGSDSESDYLYKPESSGSGSDSDSDSDIIEEFEETEESEEIDHLLESESESESEINKIFNNSIRSDHSGLEYPKIIILPFFSFDDPEEQNSPDHECPGSDINTNVNPPPPPPSSIIPVPVPAQAPNYKTFVYNQEIKECKKLTDMISLLDNQSAPEHQIELKNALIQLDGLVGMKLLKEQVLNQILFFIQDLNESGTFFHTVITGNPGTGKTTLISILAKIYKSLGILSKGTVVKADRAQLIAEYLGQTAVKTKKVLNSALGGILCIDEAYSLGDEKNDDMYSNECIDTINQYLSEHVDELICIICGYEKDIQKRIFSKNQGLARRFQWKFNIEPYTTEELYDIFKIQLGTWSTELSKEYIVKCFRDNQNILNDNGGSTRNIIDKCKINYAQRQFRPVGPESEGSTGSAVKVITKEDFDKAMDMCKKLGSKNNTNLCPECTEVELAKVDNGCVKCSERKRNSESMYC